MKRSIVQQGPSTLMVSIPMKWVKKYDLKKGMQIEVEENGRGLEISTNSKKEPKKKEVNLINSNVGYIWREISSAYLSGYDEIKVNYDSIKTYEIMEKKLLPTFLGFETVEHGDKYCILRQVLEENPNEFETFMRRIFLNLIHTSKQYISILETGENIDTIFPLEKTNNRQTYYLRRMLTKEGFKKQEKTNFVSILVFLLEQLMNEYKYSIWELEKRKNKKVQKVIINHYKQIHEKIELVYDLYFSYTPELFENIKNKTIKIDSKHGVDSTLELLKKDPVLVCYFSSMIEKLNYISFQIHAINS